MLLAHSLSIVNCCSLDTLPYRVCKVLMFWLFPFSTSSFAGLLLFFVFLWVFSFFFFCTTSFSPPSTYATDHLYAANSLSTDLHWAVSYSGKPALVSTLKSFPHIPTGCCNPSTVAVIILFFYYLVASLYTHSPVSSDSVCLIGVYSWWLLQGLMYEGNTAGIEWK